MLKLVTSTVYVPAFVTNGLCKVELKLKGPDHRKEELGALLVAVICTGAMVHRIDPLALVLTVGSVMFVLTVTEAVAVQPFDWLVTVTI